MTKPDPEPLRLPVHWSVPLAVVALLTAVLLVAGWVDRRRRAAQLAAVEQRDCAVVHPAAVLKRLDGLLSQKRTSEARGQAIARQLKGLYPPTSRLTILYPRDGEIWAVSSDRGPGPWGERELHPEWGEWPSLLGRPFCEGLIRGRSFVVGRRLVTAGQGPVLLVTSQRMSD